MTLTIRLFKDKYYYNKCIKLEKENSELKFKNHNLQMEIEKLKTQNLRRGKNANNKKRV